MRKKKEKHKEIAFDANTGWKRSLMFVREKKKKQEALKTRPVVKTIEKEGSSRAYQQKKKKSETN